MQDFIGRELEINDYVAMMRPHYRSLTLGRIVKFTPQKVRISYTNDKQEREFLCDPTCLVKLDGPDFLAFLLKKIDYSS